VGRSFDPFPRRGLDLLLRCEISPLTLAAIRNPNEAVYVTQGGVTCQAILSNAVEMPLIERRPGWGELKAVQRELIFVADGNQYFNRPGPRIVESLHTGGDLSPRILPFSGMKAEAGYVTQQSQEPTNRAVALNQPEATEHTSLMAIPNSMRAVQLRAYGASRKVQTYVMV